MKIRLLRGDAYAGYGKTFQLDTLSAEFVAMNCMLLEYKLFGHDSYRINDLELFRQSPAGTSNEGRFIFLKDVVDSNKSSRTMNNGRTTDAYLPIWTTYCVDWSVDGDEGWVDEGIVPGGVPDYSYSGFDCFDVLTYFTVISGAPTETIPVTGGGGGGVAINQWWEEDPCDHGSIPGCGDDVTFGWMPTDDMGDYFDDYETWGYRHFETWDVTAEDYAKIENWRLNNIDTAGLDSCVRKILDKMLLNSNNKIGRFLAKMERSNEFPLNIEQFNVKIVVGPLTGSWGRTLRGTFDPVTQVFTDTIIIKDSLAMFGTEIGVATTVAHELIHAYMKSIWFRYFYNAYPVNPSGLNFDSVFNVYIDTLIDRHDKRGLNSWVRSNRQYDHNFMANKLIEQMKEMAAYIDGNSNTDEFYWSLMWSGLDSTTTMLRYWPNIPAWPPTSGAPAPHNDSTWGLRYAWTEARLDSMRRWIDREKRGLSNAKGRPKIPGGCY